MCEKQLASKVEHFKSKLQAANAECRKLRGRNKELLASNEHQRSKVKKLREAARLHVAKCSGTIGCLPSGGEIRGHKYGLSIVSLCIGLYAYAGCSFRGVVKVLLYLQIELQLQWAELPSKSSVENWVQKLGLHAYSAAAGPDLYKTGYGLILDESMVIGQQRMMLVLGVAAEKVGKGAIGAADVTVLAMEVKPSWTAADIEELLEKVQAKMGKRAAYVVSDGNANLRSGIQKANLPRIADVGHQIALALEHTYKPDDTFSGFMKEVAQVRFREVMRPTAYLLPPQQRTIARFMNLSPVFAWASKMLRVLPGLSDDEKRVFGFLDNYRPLIAEMEAVFKMTHSILKKLKQEGLSVPVIEECRGICRQFAPQVPAKLCALVEKYLLDHSDKIPDGQTVWHASSDVIESLFGKFKSITAPNKLHGVTPLALMLCVMTQFADRPIDFKTEIANALTSVSIADLKQWKHDHLVDNQVVRRNATFKK